MEILESTPSAVRIRLEFNSYLGKMIHTVIDMDQMVGRDFEAGLASLKSLTEG